VPRARTVDFDSACEENGGSSGLNCLRNSYRKKDAAPFGAPRL
jgi:hypothetical protein